LVATGKKKQGMWHEFHMPRRNAKGPKRFREIGKVLVRFEGISGSACAIESKVGFSIIPQ
jgi:hypothetical protein